MKKTLAAVIMLSFILVFCSCGKGTQAEETKNKETFIDVKNTYQTVEGFGASAAWWAQSVGKWENAEKIVGLLYSEDEGIGLNVYRYNLGAGSRDTDDKSLYVETNRTNCFMTSDGGYNWDNDRGAVNALKLAKEANPNLKVTLFANSPPVYLTENGRAYLTPESESNLAEENYQAYADYIMTCAEHFIDEGYNVTSVSPMNEPEWGWSGWDDGNGSFCCNQEGCHYSADEALNFFNNYMIPSLKSNPKLGGKVGVEVWESGQMRQWENWDNYLNTLFSSKDYDYKNHKIFKVGEGYAAENGNIRDYADSITVHSYWASADDRRATAEQLGDKWFSQKVRCTEYCQMTNDGSNGVWGHIQKAGDTCGMEIDYGLALADIIYQDMTVLGAVEWDWWVGCSKGVYPDGLIYLDDENHDDIKFSKRYWCLGNYSKFIKEGAKRVEVTTGESFATELSTDEEHLYQWDDGNGNTGYDKNNYIDVSAYLNPDGSLVAVYVNNSDTAETTQLKCRGFESFETFVTDENRNLEKGQTGSVKDALTIPERSVMTVVIK